MKKQMHRLLSLMLSLILVVGMIPGTKIAHAAETTVVEITEIPSLTVGETLSRQTLKDAVPQITNYFNPNYYPNYYVWFGSNMGSVTSVTEANKDKNHYAYYIWVLDDYTEVPAPADYVVKYNGTALTYITTSDFDSDYSWYHMYESYDGEILCSAYIYLGKPAPGQSATEINISKLPSLTVGDTLSQQTLKNAVPSVTSHYNDYPEYYIWNSDSNAINTVTKVKEENKDKVHYAYFIWTLSGTEVPNASDYVVKYNGTALTHKYGSHQSSENFYRLYKGSDGNILCMVHIYLGKPAAAPGEHVHTYSENWSTDTRYHWRAATCEHTTEKADYEKHTLVDGKCKCGFEHTHDWDTAWSYSEGQHWHNCKAENCPAYYVHDRDGWGFHDADAYGNCSDCGMPMFTPSYSVLAVGGNADKTEYAPGETVTITAYDAADGYKFVGWTTKDGVEFADATNATTTFVMPAKDVRVDANYDKLSVFHITVVGGTADKEAAGENKYKAENGDTITITAYDAPDGKKFVGWQVTVNDMFVVVDLADATAKETTFEMPEGNVRVDAVFEEIESYHVTVVGGTADKETAGENKYKAEPGETIKITAYEPGSNQKFVGWEVTVNDMFVSVELADKTAAETTFTMPNGNVRVDAVFEEIESYHVTVVGGTADKETAGENKYKAEPGETIMITAYAPGSNQKFVGWEVTVNDMFVAVELADASAAETTFTMPNGNVRVDAVFEEIESYHVTVVGGTADKEAAGENKYKAEPGETIKITAYAPGSNQKFVGWEVTVNDMFVAVELADKTAAETTFTMPNGNVRVDAVFEEIESYHVTVVGGTADREAAEAGENQYKAEPGETVKITAYAPGSNQKFVGWKVTVNDMFVAVELADASAAETTFTMPNGNVRVDAVFEEIESYHVTVVGGTADKETAGENKYKAEPGETITITAYEAADGKKFAGWKVTVNDMFVDVALVDATKTTTTFVMPEGDVRVDATYEDEVIPPTTDGDTNTPQTGDNSMIWLWIALLFVIEVGVVATTVFWKKRFSVK